MASTSHLSCVPLRSSTVLTTSLVFSAPDVVATSTCYAATVPDTHRSSRRTLTAHRMSASGLSRDVDRCRLCRWSRNHLVAAAAAHRSRRGNLRSRQFQVGPLALTAASRAAVRARLRCLTHASCRLPPRADGVDATHRELASCGEASMTRTCHCHDVVTPVAVMTS